MFVILTFYRIKGIIILTYKSYQNQQLNTAEDKIFKKVFLKKVLSFLNCFDIKKATTGRWKQLMKYYEVVAKCGHVGRNKYYEGHFFIIADSEKKCS